MEQKFVHGKKYDITDGSVTIRYTYNKPLQAFIPEMSYFRGYYRIDNLEASSVITSPYMTIKEVE